MAGKSKGARADDQQLVELLLAGGPRLATGAFAELSTRIRDGHDIVRLLPSPEGLERVKRHQVFSLMRSAFIRRQDAPALLKLSNQQSVRAKSPSLTTPCGVYPLGV